MRSIFASAHTSSIGIGFQGESNGCRVVFNITGYTDYTVILLHTRNGDTTPYEVNNLVVDQEKRTATWYVDNTDTSNVGEGTIELQLRDGDTLVKNFWTTKVSKTSTESTVDPPDPYTQWYDKMAAEAATAKASATEAEKSAESAGEYSDAASKSATNASSSEQAASEFAEAAETSAAESGLSADQASEYSNAASQSADRAEQAAKNAGYMYFYEENGHVHFMKTTNVETDFNIENGRLEVVIP